LRSAAEVHKRLLDEGHALLARGDAREAALRFSRVLLEDPGHQAARRGASAAQALLDEECRLSDLSRQPTVPAADDGGLGTEAVRGAEATRIEVEEPAVESRPITARKRVVPRSLSAPSGLSRAVLLSAFALLVVGALGTVVSGWERLLGRLTAAPRPASSQTPSATTLRSASPAEEALREARQHLASGAPALALRALEGIPEPDPHWPYARRLRAEAEAALVRTGGLR
jgi:hypothetical protein